MIRWLTVFFLFFSFLIIFGSSKPQYDFAPIPAELTRVSGEVHPEKAEENILGRNVKPIVLQPAAQPNFPAHSHMPFENKAEPVLPRPQTGIVPPPTATEESSLTLTSAELAKETTATDVGASEKSPSEVHVNETVASKTSSAESDSTSEEKTKPGSEISGYDAAASNTETPEVVVAANITKAPIVESSSVLVEQTTSISATTSNVTTKAPKDSELKKTTAPTVVSSEASTIVDEKKEAQSTTTTVSEKNGTVEATPAAPESGNASIAASLTPEVPSESVATLAPSVQSYENGGSSDDKKPEESTAAVVEKDKNASVIVATPLTTSKANSGLQTSKVTTVSSTKASETTKETKTAPEQKVENKSDVASTTLPAAESSPQATIKTSTQPPSIESKTAPEVITSGYENAGIEPEPTPDTSSEDTKLVDSPSKASETSIKAEASNATTASIIPPTEEAVNNSAAIPENQNLKTVAETQNVPKITSAASVVSENESTTTLASETATKTNETKDETTLAPYVSENRETSEAQAEGYEAATVTGAPEAPTSKSSAIGPVAAASEAYETATAAISASGTTISSVESSYDSISLKEKTLASITKEETTTIVAAEILSTTATPDNQKNKTASIKLATTSVALVASKAITSVPEAPSEGTTPLASISAETSTSATSTSEANEAAGYDNPVTQTSAKSETKVNTEAASKTLTVTNGSVASTNHDVNLAQKSTPATSTSEAAGYDNPVTQTSAKSIETASETSTLTNGSVAHTNQVVTLAQTSTPATSTSEASETAGYDNSVIQTSAKSETKLSTDAATTSAATSIHPQTQSSPINAPSTIVESSTASTKGSSNTSKHGKKSKTKHPESETASREVVEPSGYSGNEPLSAEQIKQHPSNVVLPHDAVGYNGIEAVPKTSEQKDIAVDSETKGVVEHLRIRKIDNSTKSKWKPFVMDCENEVDDKGEFLCKEWAKGGLCDKHKATMFLFCRKTCLCDGPPIADDSSEEKRFRRNNLLGNRLRKFQFH